jgi:HK97 family phage prohead protease
VEALMPKPNDAMAKEAERGLAWRREFGRGGTEVGIARARDISNKENLSLDTVRRMSSYFARHEVDKEAEGFRPGEDGYPSNGRIAWALWGGDSGKSWANRILEQEDDDRSLVDEGEASVLYSTKHMEATMAEREIRAIAQPLEVREEEDQAIRVSGYAAVFNEETNIAGMFTEVIEQGAFTGALERQDDVVFLVNHDGLPLARTRSGTLRLTQDERGLFMETELDGSDPDVRSIVPKMKRGDLDKMSFAFIPTRQEWDDSGDMPKRMIQDLQLHDVAIVTTPAYSGTEIGLRSLEAHRAKETKNQAARRLRMKAKF